MQDVPVWVAGFYRRLFRKQHFLQPGKCFLKLCIYCFHAYIQFFCYLCVALFLFAYSDENFTATFGKAVERFYITREEFLADEGLFR